MTDRLPSSARTLLCLALSLAMSRFSLSRSIAQGSPNPVPAPGLKLTLWAREPMLKNPVALSFDDLGRLYVVETARRGTVDIDIRAHPDWLVEDLSNQSVDDLRTFFRRRMSPDLSTTNKRWLRDLNNDGIHDWRDLTTIKERIHILEDTRGTGVADRSTLFAEGFNEEINGVLAGVMPWKDHAFATVYPDLWRLKDTNGDGIADEKESLFRGFGVHAAFDGHDLHGLTVGPEGKIYFSIGDNGFSVTNREGRRLHFPNTGGVLRMNPDGSDLEVFAHGLRNPQEIAFDEFGNLFSVDNDGDLGDERERFVYITEGSDSGWRLHWQFRDQGWARQTRMPDYNPWTADRMWVPHHQGQPAHITPPLSNYSVGPGGFKYNPGTAINEFYRRHFFLVQFPVQKVTAFQVTPRGAAFEMVGEHIFLQGMMASAVNFGPDGALYVADWDGMWNPNEKGAIWRMDDPRTTLANKRREVQNLLRAPSDKQSTRDLLQWLGHEDMRIRQKAQFELVARKELASLFSTARNPGSPQLARIHSLWGLAQAKPSPAPAASDLPLNDADPEIRAQSARIAGDLRLTNASPTLVSLLKDPGPRVQYHAAVALGKTAFAPAFQPVVSMLESNRNTDPFIRHACVLGLTGIGDTIRLAQLSSHPSSAVRLGAVVALRRLQSPLVAKFLLDPDAAVRRDAARAIHDDESIPSALPQLARLIDSSAAAGDEAMARRCINANLRLGQRENAYKLIEFALHKAHPEPLRIEALQALASWDRSPFIDRVEGLIRTLPPRTPGLGVAALRTELHNLLTHSSEALAEALANIAADTVSTSDTRKFEEWASSKSQAPALRIASLKVLARHDPTNFFRLLRNSLTDASPQIRIAALQLFSRHQPAEFLAHVENNSPGFSTAEAQAILASEALIKKSPASPFLASRLAALNQGSLPPGLALDVLDAASKSADPRVKSSTPAPPDFQNAASLQNPWLQAALVGGDAARGRTIFRTHVNAQCVRCHDAGGEGAQAGPVLSSIGSRLKRTELLEALLFPSARIAAGYETISLTLKDGESIDGIKIREDSSSIVLRTASGEIQTIPSSRIDQRSTSSVSAMPPMGEVLSPSQLRDLVEYLAGLNTP